MAAACIKGSSCSPEPAMDTQIRGKTPKESGESFGSGSICWFFLENQSYVSAKGTGTMATTDSVVH